MKVIKRNGSEVDFHIEKIQAAVDKANRAAVSGTDGRTDSGNIGIYLF